MSSINSLIILNVNSPGFLTEIPSAIVLFPSTDSNFPDSMDFFMAGNAVDCTPMTFTLGFFVFIARKTPAARPPPPIGRYTSSTFGRSFIFLILLLLVQKLLFDHQRHVLFDHLFC